MKKTQKKLFGLFGLGAVVALTAFAATLPGPGASATTTSATDVISVRVVGAVPDVNILGINSGETIVVPDQSFTVSYENVDTLSVILEHTDLDGNVNTYVIDEFVPDYEPGEQEYNVHFIK